VLKTQICVTRPQCVKTFVHQVGNWLRLFNEHVQATGSVCPQV